MHEFPIVDAHLHIWDPREVPIPWVAGRPLFDRRYDLANYAEATAGLPIEAMVYVQVNVAAPYALVEPRWVAEQALTDPRLQGIVAWAPLESGESCRSYLQALTSIGPIVKGVRRMTQMEADPEFCVRPDFIRAVRLLPEYGLSCDIDLDYPQLPLYIRLVEACPDTSFILCHLAKPGIRDRVLDPWREHMRTLAAFPNVVAKVSGMTTQAHHTQWTLDDLRPFFDWTLEVFGEDRIAFGGDWPVVLQGTSYVGWVETLTTLSASLSPEAKRKLWAGNARRYYRLPA
jgi:L-fuconolactonase